MRPYELFINICDKEELIQVIGGKGIKVNGFRNIARAPIQYLQGALRDFFSKGGEKNFRRYVKNGGEGAKVYADLDLQGFIFQMVKSDLPQHIGLLIFLNLYPEEVEEYLPKFVANYEQGRNIFDLDLLDVKVTEENASEIFNEFHNLTSLMSSFYSYQGEALKRLAALGQYEEYMACRERFQDITWETFVERYFEHMNDYSLTNIFLAYLLGNKEQIKGEEAEEARQTHVMMMYEVLLQLERSYEEHLDTTIDEKNEEIKKQGREIEDLKNTEKSLQRDLRSAQAQEATSQEEVKRAQREVQNLRQSFQKLQQEHRQLGEQLKTSAKKNQQLENQLHTSKREYQQQLDNLATEKNREIGELQSQLDQCLLMEDVLADVDEYGEEIKYFLVHQADSPLFPLFFGKYGYVNSEQNYRQIVQQIQAAEHENKLVVLNRHGMSTGELLELEEELQAHGINKKTIMAFTAKQFIKEALRLDII